MKKTILLLVSYCLLSSWPALANDDAKLDEVKKEIAKLQQWLHAAQSESDQLNQDLRQSDIEINQLNQKIEQTRKAIAEEQRRLKKLQREQGQLHSLQRQQREFLAEQIRSAYRIGNEGPIKLLLNQNDPQQAQRMLTFFAYFNEARMARINTILAELKRLDNLAEMILQTKSLLEQQEKSQRANTQRLQQKKSQQQTLLAKLKASMANEQQRLQQKEQDRKRLEQLLHEVQTILDNSPRQIDSQPITRLKGHLPQPAKGRVLQAFGGKRYPGHSKGWLIEANAGANVYAIHHGRVIFSDWVRGYGLVMILDHGQGYLSLYAHNQSLLREVGSWVNQGDVIAGLGRSGGQEMDALYFEIRYRGRTQDPALWLKR